MGLKIGHKLIKSPFREDKKPTCSFYYSKSGRLYLHDFGTGQHIDCFEVVKLKFGISYNEAVKRIIDDQEHFVPNEVLTSSNTRKIEFIIGDYGSFEYYNRFHISNPTLLKYNVYPAKVIYQDEVIIARGSKLNPLFVYLSSSGNIKWYRPLAKDSTKK